MTLTATSSILDILSFLFIKNLENSYLNLYLISLCKVRRSVPFSSYLLFSDADLLQGHIRSWQCAPVISTHTTPLNRNEFYNTIAVLLFFFFSAESNDENEAFFLLFPFSSRFPTLSLMPFSLRSLSRGTQVNQPMNNNLDLSLI